MGEYKVSAVSEIYNAVPDIMWETFYYGGESEKLFLKNKQY